MTQKSFLIVTLAALTLLAMPQIAQAQELNLSLADNGSISARSIQLILLLLLEQIFKHQLLLLV